MSSSEATRSRTSTPNASAKIRAHSHDATHGRWRLDGNGGAPPAGHAPTPREGGASSSTEGFAGRPMSSSQIPYSYERHTADLSRAIVEFLTPLLPSEEEYRAKEAVRRQLLGLATKLHPDAKLLAFGSMANGFALRYSDMDLCCLVPPNKSEEKTRTSAELVEALSDLIRRETDFHVLPLPQARIPILKISRAKGEAHPYDMACDIGFNNRLALENTRLLLSYAMLDPPRLRSLVLFVKVWTKRRKLNAPFTGTLSSYGYTLMVLFFLIHVKRPPVLPNLQRIPTRKRVLPEDIVLEGHNIYFFDDMEALRQSWHSDNTESLGELLLDFFRYFSRDFNYTKDAMSIRTEGGLITKESRGWQSEMLGIEDPFQAGYNVARTVTKDGLYTIRGEFMRASRLLANRSVRAPQLLADLCAEREDGLTRAPDARHDGRGRMHGRPMQVPRERMPFSGSTMAFEDMARGLVQGVSFPPSHAMLAPLAQTYGLYPAMPGPPYRTSRTTSTAPPSANSSPQRKPRDVDARVVMPPPSMIPTTSHRLAATSKPARSLSESGTPRTEKDRYLWMSPHTQAGPWSPENLAPPGLAPPMPGAPAKEREAPTTRPPTMDSVQPTTTDELDDVFGMSPENP